MIATLDIFTNMIDAYVTLDFRYCEEEGDQASASQHYISHVIVYQTYFM